MKRKAFALILCFATMMSISIPGTFAVENSTLPTTVCERAEHTHDENCYTQANEPQCGIEESEEHSHGEACYTVTLSCPVEEHSHSDACYAEAEEATQEAPISTSTSFENLPEEIQNTILGLIYAKEGLDFSKAAIRSASLQRTAQEMIDAKWFTVSPQNVVEVPSAGIAAGEIADNATIPTAEGYTFVGAYFNGVQVLRIGQIQYDVNGDGTAETFVYYVTNPDNTDLVAQVLSERDTIELRYGINLFGIHYTVSVDGQPVSSAADGSFTMQGIPYGKTTESTVTVLTADRPVKVFKDGSYSFRVEIPRGYQATVSVNGTPLSPKLGVSPTYDLEKDGSGHRVGNGTIIKTDPAAEYALACTYTVDNVNGEQNVEVNITKAAQPTFSAELISYTAYFGGSLNVHGGRATSYINAKPNGNDPYWDQNSANTAAWAGTFENGKLEWDIKTNYVEYSHWILNALQLNGYEITLPFGTDHVKTTVLPSGTTVQVKLAGTSGTSDQVRYYSVSITNCYENVVVTGGNLNGTNHHEYIPYVFTGVAQMQYLNKNSEWKDVSISRPIERTEIDGKCQLHFRMLPGYGLPTFELVKSDNAHTTIFSPQNMVDKDADGWYTVNFSNVAISDEDFPVLIFVKAEQVFYKVFYTAGEVTDAAPIPTDDNSYTLAVGGDADVLTPLSTPIDPNGKKVFVGWKNGDKVYKRNQNIPITDLVSTWNSAQSANITFTAQWADADAVNMISYTLEVHRSDLPDGEDTLQATYTSEAPKGVDVVIDVHAGSLQAWLATNHWLEVDMDRSQLYYESLENGRVINLYVKEKTAKINYVAVGPAGKNFGRVSLANEIVKLKSGELTGSTATAAVGYRFVGWFSDEACTQAVPDSWVAGGKISPTKADTELWVETTYYAKFEYGRADLTIKKTGAQDIDENQSFVFTVSGTANDGTTVNMKVVVHGNGSVTIKDLPIGTYTVTEDTGWSWRYDPEGISKEITLTADGENKVGFSNTRRKLFWLNGCAWCDNRWISGIAIQDER